MSNFKVEQVYDSVMNFVGKNLFHCKDTNMMFWCDVLGGQVFKMDLNNHNKMYMFRIIGEKTISFCFPIHGKKDQFIVGAGKRLLMVNWDGVHTMGQILKVLAELPVNGVRINTGKVDKMGRLFFGTMISEEQGDVFNLQKRIGSLYRYTMGEGLVQIKDNVGLCNGIGWNNAYNKMFFIDSFDTKIYEFDFDVKTGGINNQKVFMDMTTVSSLGKGKKIFPSSLMVDFDDHIFVTIFGNGKIMKINYKNNKVEDEIKFNNVHQLSGCEFGGQNLDTMFVTTIGMNLYGQDNDQVYPSGYLMKVNNFGCKGVYMHKFIST